MSPYRQDPHVAEPAPPPKRPPVHLVVALSAAAHVAVIGACALAAPKAPEPPRTATVRVVGAHAVDDEAGEAGWTLTGYADAVIRER
jgi:hypothetical protein